MIHTPSSATHQCRSYKVLEQRVDRLPDAQPAIVGRVAVPAVVVDVRDAVAVQSASLVQRLEAIQVLNVLPGLRHVEHHEVLKLGLDLVEAVDARVEAVESRLVRRLRRVVRRREQVDVLHADEVVLVALLVGQVRRVGAAVDEVVVHGDDGVYLFPRLRVRQARLVELRDARLQLRVREDRAGICP